MDAFHARYPFLTSSRDAAQDASVDIDSIVTAPNHPILRRALDRVESAIESGTSGSIHRSTQIELLSYPLARVLVSLVNDAGLTQRYAHAEAQTAYERFTSDFESTTQLRSVSAERITLEELLDEFNLQDKIVTENNHYLIDATAYLRLTGSLDEDQWRLVNRSLEDGHVKVSAPELFTLLREGIQQRIEADLPLSVPDEIASDLTSIVTQIRSKLSETNINPDIDTVQPDLFPPCMNALLAAVDDNQELESHSLFTITSFLASIGMDSADIIDRISSNPSIDTQTLEYQLAHLRESTTDNPMYPPSSCETMVAYGDCVNKDELCESISHPLEYYDEQLRVNG